ncbi:MAG: ribosome maturation factor RimM [Acidobacteriaceae bacterium]|jgi:16S rRNA processing protein RimM
MDRNPTWIVLAQVLRPQGRKGEVLADLLTDFPGRFASHPRVFLAPPGLAGPSAPNTAPAPAPSAPPQPVDVASHWLPVGRNAGRIVLHFAGIDTIEQAQQLAGKQVLVPFTERTPLEPGAAYVSDLIGCTVYDRGQPIGLVDAVQFPTSPDGSHRLKDAAPLLAIASPEGGELLIPFANAFILELDLASKSIRMALPEGLTQINHSTSPPHH